MTKIKIDSSKLGLNINEMIFSYKDIDGQYKRTNNKDNKNYIILGSSSIVSSSINHEKKIFAHCTGSFTSIFTSNKQIDDKDKNSENINKDNKTFPFILSDAEKDYYSKRYNLTNADINEMNENINKSMTEHVKKEKEVENELKEQLYSHLLKNLSEHEKKLILDCLIHSENNLLLSFDYFNNLFGKRVVNISEENGLTINKKDIQNDNNNKTVEHNEFDFNKNELLKALEDTRKYLEARNVGIDIKSLNLNLDNMNKILDTIDEYNKVGFDGSRISENK